MAMFIKTITKFFSIRHSYNSHLLYSISRIFNKNFDIYCQQISTIILIKHCVRVDFIHFLISAKYLFTFKIYLNVTGIIKSNRNHQRLLIFGRWKFWHKYFHIWRQKVDFYLEYFETSSHIIQLFLNFTNAQCILFALLVSVVPFHIFSFMILPTTNKLPPKIPNTAIKNIRPNGESFCRTGYIQTPLWKAKNKIHTK